MEQQSHHPSHLRLSLLGSYLNDHLAGSSGGVEQLRWLASVHRGDEAGRELAELAEQVAEDRRALLEIMDRLGVPVRRYKALTGWLAEKARRLKPNGRLLERSPLSDILELETMRLGVEGKALGWRTLRVLADTDERLDAAALDELLRRAAYQAEALERLRTRMVRPVFTPGGGRPAAASADS